MRTTDFIESGMAFSFPAEGCYRIEHSPTHKGLGENVKICECVVRKGETVLFIEAKTTFSNPEKAEDFRTGIREITEKFRNSILLYAGLLTERPYKTAEPLPPGLSLEAVSRKPMKCYLIIRRHTKEWLPQVNDALKVALLPIKKTFAIEDVIVLNAELALKHHLIQSVQS